MDKETLEIVKDLLGTVNSLVRMFAAQQKTVDALVAVLTEDDDEPEGRIQ